MLTKEKVLELIEPHFFKDIKEDLYKEKSIHASELLTYNRLDIAFKLLYLEMLPFHVKFAKDIYINHIRAFSLGTYIEPGDEDKNSIDIFIDEFHKTFENIRDNSFNSAQSLIPLSTDGSIANGAHRVASAIYLNKIVQCIEIKTNSPLYNYEFFYNRNVPTTILDTTVTTFIKYASNVYIAFLWPVGRITLEEAKTLIPNIIYTKKIKLNSNGAHNLLSQIYYGEEWLGSIQNNYKGAHSKVLKCFKTFNEFHVIAFQAKNLQEVLHVKDTVRRVCGVGKHSIHITDTKEEATRTANIIFNDNSLHFLNYAKPNRFLSTHKKINKFKYFIKKNNLKNNNLLIDSSLVLSLYGLREAKDTDFLCSDNNKIKIPIQNINSHDDALQHYADSKNNLIYNDQNYFYYNDLKFISFSKLYTMKSNRNELKDIHDCNMMEALIEHNKLREVFARGKQNMLYAKVQLKHTIVAFLKAIKVYKYLTLLIRRNTK